MNARQVRLFCTQLSLGAILLLTATVGGAEENLAPPDQTQPQSAADVLKAFEPAADQEYQVGPGDEISVDVSSRPELSGKHVVGPDGRITLPLAGDIELEGKTRAEAGTAIRTSLDPYYQNITASVSVDRYTSNSILLLGAVEHPGLLSFDSTPTLLEVVARGGMSPGQTGSASLNPSISSPVTLPEVCIIYRGNQTMVTVRLLDLVKRGDPAANIRLKRMDTVYIPGEYPFVSILGSVLHPGLIRLGSGATVPQLLAEAGGFADKAGRYPKIYIVHPAYGDTPGSVRVVSFHDIVDAKVIHPVIHSGDILYVGESGFNRTGDVLQKISPLISLVTVAALLQ